jgi:hypothetical protein
MASVAEKAGDAICLTGEHGVIDHPRPSPRESLDDGLISDRLMENHRRGEPCGFSKAED